MRRVFGVPCKRTPIRSPQRGPRDASTSLPFADRCRAHTVRVRGVSGFDRYSHTDMYYYPWQLEGRWAGDSEGRPLGDNAAMKPTSTMGKVSAVASVGSARNSSAIR